MKKRKWNGEIIPREEWGRDHMSTLVYVETRAVDHSGQLMVAHLRDGVKYPTRLKDSELIGHTDWHCLDDLEEAGLLINNGTGINRVYSLTDEGWKVAGLERRRRAEINA